MTGPARRRPPADVTVVWVMLGLIALAVLVTYARVPVAELYHVSAGGFEGGVGRALVFVNFPVALVAIGILGVLLEHGAPRVPAWTAIVLCAVTAWPDVVSEDDLDVKVVNAVPALGVFVAVVLTAALRPTARLAARRALDPLRLVIAVVAVVASIPWFFADLGFYAPDPLLAEEVPPGETLAAVHLGHHHGMDGMLLTLAALLLSRVARSRPLRATLALMFVYGVANLAQDGWHEQLVKRGTTDVEIPPLLVPEPSVAWAALLALAAGLYLADLRLGRPRRLRTGPATWRADRRPGVGGPGMWEAPRHRRRGGSRGGEPWQRSTS